MSILDNILGQLSGNMDVANLAAKVGLSPEHVESAISALAKAHPLEGDTAESAASISGLPLDKIQEVLTHLGGEGTLSHFASLIQGEGNPLGGLGDLAAGLFGKK